MSPPRENVLFVPSRNVLLTRSGWEGVRTRKPHHDATRQRPSGRAQEDEEEDPGWEMALIIPCDRCRLSLAVQLCKHPLQ
jgi:hypothetical protein